MVDSNNSDKVTKTNKLPLVPFKKKRKKKNDVPFVDKVRSKGFADRARFQKQLVSIVLLPERLFLTTYLEEGQAPPLEGRGVALIRFETTSTRGRKNSIREKSN